jgi:hypothetical protein
MGRTAAEIAESLARATKAVQGYYGHESRSGDLGHEATVARETIRYAMRVDGHTVAAIAAAAKTEQLLVARLAPPEVYAEALHAARHDAERRRTEVMDAIRDEALRRWHAGRDEHGIKARVCKEMRIGRDTLDQWIAASDWARDADREAVA